MNPVVTVMVTHGEAKGQDLKYVTFPQKE